MADWLLATRRVLGVARAYVKDSGLHFKRTGGEYPSIVRRLSEQAGLMLLNAITVSDYYYFGLYRSDKSWREKRQYVGHYLVGRTYGAINSPSVEFVLKDKVVFRQICAANRLPMVEVLGTYSEHDIKLPWSHIPNIDALRDFLLRDGAENVFIKPSGAQEGAGVLSLGKRLDATGWESLPLRSRVSIEQVIAHVQADWADMDWLIERRALPHPEMAEVIPNICSTVRLITLNNRKLGPRILGALVRFGTGDSAADNHKGSGLVAMVDLETGVIGKCLNASHGIAEFCTSHPRTGVPITGRMVPDWERVKDLAIESAKVFGYFNCVGWDVGVTDKGPVLIEGNGRSGLSSMQILSDKGLLAGPFGDVLRSKSGISKSGIVVPKC